MKKRVIVKGIINYIFAMIFSIIFGLFLDANVGWFILLTLILAPGVSVFFAWLSARMIAVSCEMEEAVLSKGDTCTMSVSVRNKSIFPTPPMAVKFTNEAGARCENSNQIVSVMPRSAQTFTVLFKAKICGKSRVGIESIYVTDYLGLFSFAVKKLDYSALQRTVAVIPDIAEISARDDNIVKVMQTSLHMDDSEDTVEASAYSFGGFPGFDNRDYVPGDPLKRINWKQSAKRNRLMVRLDDEMASRAVNVVLDSVFLKDEIDILEAGALQQYKDLAEDEILPKIAEDAVENALGIVQVLVRHNYTVNFYVCREAEFSKYEIGDESDLETVRLELAHYSFYEDVSVPRIPVEDTAFAEKVGLFSTPNRYENAYAVLEDGGHTFHTTIYSVLEEAVKLNSGENMVLLQDIPEKREDKRSLKEKIVAAAKPLVVPYLLALLLSIAIFSVFEVPLLSWWTLSEILVCAGIMTFCVYVNRHRVIGTFLVILLVMGILNAFIRIVFAVDFSVTYTHWFMSGGESVANTFSYLLSLLIVFTVFFAMVVYYFTQVHYRTSFLMLISLVPFVAYVKVMQDINMVHVVLVTVLNVVMFLVNSRMQRDRGKPIVGYLNGFVSVGMYVTILVLIGLALPEAETQYYYMFENAFLGGNVSEAVPEEYSGMSEYSGNADGFNQLNNRKLYVISNVASGTELYLKRQNFDLYDFENDRWYAIDDYAEAVYTPEEWAQRGNNTSVAMLATALCLAEDYDPEILTEYGLKEQYLYYFDDPSTLYIETTNFSSVGYIAPPNAVEIYPLRDVNGDAEHTFVSKHGIFMRDEGFLNKNLFYQVDYYDESDAGKIWMERGYANFDYDTSLELLTRAERVLEENEEVAAAAIVAGFLEETRAAQEYGEACSENTALIPKRIRELAEEITKDCTYDWEKAAALQNYFRENDFVYDLSYDAPDDSVEYFLFEGKTGTCSDYASAYVLMARSVGLIVRYAEGFVPDEEYNGEYVVRTNCGHAYPEVYIPNMGFVVYEATNPASYGTIGGGGEQSGAMTYFMMVGFRVLLVFAAVSAVIVAILFIHMVAAPYVMEAYFLWKVKKAETSRAIVMLYKRIQKKDAKDIIKKAAINTPYEYAGRFEQIVGYDISELAYMVEWTAYARGSLSETDKAKALGIYREAQNAIKEWKKLKKKREGRR